MCISLVYRYNAQQIIGICFQFMHTCFSKIIYIILTFPESVKKGFENYIPNYSKYSIGFTGAPSFINSKYRLAPSTEKYFVGSLT